MQAEGLLTAGFIGRLSSSDRGGGGSRWTAGIKASYNSVRTDVFVGG
jgi:hypothetical protein